MARTITSPTWVPSDAIMTADVVLPNVSPHTLQRAFTEAFPFPAGALVVGHKILHSSEDGIHVFLFACSTNYANGNEENGLASLKDDGVLWLIPPASATWSKKTRVVSCVLIGAIFVALQSMNAGAQRRVQFLQNQNKNAQVHSLPSVATAFSPFFSRFTNCIPPAVTVLEMDVDLAKRALRLKARAPHFGSVSDTVEALGRIEGLTQARANKSQLIQIQDSSAVEFTVEAVLL